MRSPGSPRISRTENPLLPGSWEPGRFGLADALTIKLTLIFVAGMRGFDYLTPTPRTSSVQESMQTAFPMTVWAALVLIPAAALAAGLLLRVHFAVWLGHGILAIIYAALTVSIGWVYMQNPLWDGIRSATALLVPTVLHALLCVRTGWRPPRWESTATGELEVIERDG